MSNVVVNENLEKELKVLGDVATSLGSLIHRDSLFKSALEDEHPNKDLLDKYPLKMSFDDEMYSWESFIEEELNIPLTQGGDEIAPLSNETLPEGRTDELIQALIVKASEAVGRIVESGVTEDELKNLSDSEANPFRKYGLEGFQRLLADFAAEHQKLVNAEKQSN